MRTAVRESLAVVFDAFIAGAVFGCSALEHSTTCGVRGTTTGRFETCLMDALLERERTNRKRLFACCRQQVV